MATLEERTEKIVKLLAKAAVCGEEEAQTYAEHAAKLMARHQITQDMIDAKRGHRSGIIERLFTMDCAYPEQACVILSSIAISLHCKPLTIRPRHGAADVKQLIVVGIAADVDRVQKLGSLIINQALFGVFAAEAPEIDVDRFRRSWLISFGSSVGLRLEMIERRAAQEYDLTTAGAAAGAELVLRGKDAAAADYVTEKYGYLPTDHTVGDFFGSADGLLAGMSADIGLEGVER